MLSVSGYKALTASREHAGKHMGLGSQKGPVSLQGARGRPCAVSQSWQAHHCIRALPRHWQLTATLSPQIPAPGPAPYLGPAQLEPQA